MIRKKKKKLSSPSINDVTSRIRGFILDSQIQHGHELSVILGCSAVSDEVAEREEEESDKRLTRIEYLLPLIYAYAHLLAEGAAEFQKQNLPPELKEIPEELWDESRRMMEQLSLASVMGAISQLVDLNLLTIPKEKK